MAAPVTDSQDLESVLLRQSVGALEADRSCCDDCGRTPLLGEHVYLYGGRRTRTVCELCRMLRRDAPLESAVVRHACHGHSVRITRTL